MARRDSESDASPIVRLAWRIAEVVFLIALAALTASRARGQEIPATVRKSEVDRPSLLFKTSAPGAYVQAPILDTDVSIRVTGMIVRGEVSQRFRNGTGSCVEGIYVFPLPEDAAVAELRMTIGGRIIEAEVRERQEAKRIYTEAAAHGQKASLVEQERPNVFTTSVARIGPDEEIQVVLVYQQALRFDQGRFRLRFPTVVGPRYIPGTLLASNKVAEGPPVPGGGGTGWAADTDAVPDASRITPPVVDSALGKRNPVHVRLDLDAGFPVSRITSGTHLLSARAVSGSASRYQVALADEQVFADRDLEVTWEPDLGRDPKAAVFTQSWNGETYALLMIVPPAPAETPAARLPRETVFVIDTSGSMHGTSIDGARRALIFALKRLSPEDRFNVIEFNSVTRALYSDTRRALPGEVDEAVRWVSRLEAQGGTEMLPALKAALETSSEEESVRQVLFMTDGAVGNEEELFRYIRDHLGKTRLFTVGLGSAPNSHFMTKAAEFGRGTFTYVANPAEVEPKMTELFRKLESPVLTNLEVRWDDASAETWPAKVPDLYAGEPLVVAARLSSATGGVTVAGSRGGRPWSATVALSDASRDSGVDRLWARRKIAALTDELSGSGNSDRDTLRARVVQVALAHHLVSDYTSLVAVDATPAAAGTNGQTCEARPIPIELPDGWSQEHVFGGMPQTATPGRLLLLCGAAAFALGILLRARSGGTS